VASDAVEQQVEVSMGRNARPSALKHERERKKAEKQAKKRERREQRKNEPGLSDVVSLEQQEEGPAGEGTSATDPPNAETSS
jgi:hypothetical protein